MPRGTRGVSTQEQYEKESFLRWRADRFNDWQDLRIEGHTMSFAEYIAERNAYLQENKQWPRLSFVCPATSSTATLK
jgi:hypothetical protein